MNMWKIGVYQWIFNTLWGVCTALETRKKPIAINMPAYIV